MKLETNNQAIEVSGGSNTGSFSIAMNGKAFRVLSDTLYQNKIGSVVREVSCNAYDAHVMAGKADVPFVVHLPDNFEPWFAVQDFGVGLSDEDIKNVFTVYFQSTKDSSNDAIGAFGLGAKTPFSYTDQFTVTSTVNGVKSTYSAFIGPAGVPDMQLMDSQPSTDSNGVEIKMSVRSQDFNTFKNELRQQLRFFAVKPTVENDSSFAFDTEPSSVFQNEHISILDGTVYGSDINIVQGGVGYKLDKNNLVGKISDAAMRVLLPLINKGRIARLHFSIGEIGVTASREGVEYNADTCASIEKKLLAVAKTFESHLKVNLDDNMSLWDKALWLQKNNPFGTAKSVVGLLPAGTSFDSAGNVTFRVLDFLTDNKISVAQKFSHMPKSRYFRMIDVSPREDHVFLIKDKCSFSGLRVKKYFADNPNRTTAYILDSSDVTADIDSTFADKFSKLIGDCKNVINLSTIQLDKTEREKLAAKRKSTVAEWYLYDGDRIERQFTYVQDITEKSVYVYFSHGELEESISIVNKYNLLKNFYDGDIPQLIGVKISQKTEIGNNKNLMHLSEFLESIDEKDYVHLRRQHRNAVFNQHVQNNVNLYAVMNKYDVFAKAAPNSNFARLLGTRKKIAATVRSTAATRAAQYFGWSNQAPKRAEVYVNFANRTLDKLALMREYMERPAFFSNISTEHLVQYVKFVPH